MDSLKVPVFCATLMYGHPTLSNVGTYIIKMKKFSSLRDHHVQYAGFCVQRALCAEHPFESRKARRNMGSKPSRLIVRAAHLS